MSKPRPSSGPACSAHNVAMHYINRDRTPPDAGPRWGVLTLSRAKGRFFDSADEAMGRNVHAMARWVATEPAENARHVAPDSSHDEPVGLDAHDVALGAVSETRFFDSADWFGAVKDIHTRVGPAYL